jgi:hypothetical protein
VDVVSELYYYTDRVLFVGVLALQIRALIDCATRKVAAFPAVDKLTKPAWLAMLVLGGLFTGLSQNALGIFSLIATVIASVYLADVRPAVREISGGTNR